MGHLVFLGLHFIALLFLFPALIVTIPLHLIYAASSSRSAPPPPAPGTPHPSTHVRCPECREFIFKDAVVCKHCGCKLIPQT